jgi:DNA repair ATPase RecN
MCPTDLKTVSSDAVHARAHSLHVLSLTLSHFHADDPVTRPEAPAQRSSSSGAQPATRARSTAFINGAATPLRNVRTIGAALVDVNGQNAAISLRDSATQLALLDRLARTTRVAANFGERLGRLRYVESRLAELAQFEDDSLREGEEEMLQRIEALDPAEGELDLLRATLRRLDGRASAVQECSEADSIIGGRTPRLLVSCWHSCWAAFSIDITRSVQGQSPRSVTYATQAQSTQAHRSLHNALAQ